MRIAAWGAYAADITNKHSLEYGLGENSPLERIYDLNGWVLLLGVRHDHNTSIHLAEYRANYKAKKGIINRAGKDFERDSSFTVRGTIANAEVILMPQRQLIDYAVKWLERNRS